MNLSGNPRNWCNWNKTQFTIKYYVCDLPTMVIMTICSIITMVKLLLVIVVQWNLLHFRVDHTDDVNVLCRFFQKFILAQTRYTTYTKSALKKKKRKHKTKICHKYYIVYYIVYLLLYCYYNNIIVSIIVNVLDERNDVYENYNVNRRRLLNDCDNNETIWLQAGKNRWSMGMSKFLIKKREVKTSRYLYIFIYTVNNVSLI